MDPDVKIDVLAVKKLEKSCADFYFSAQRYARLRSLRMILERCFCVRDAKLDGQEEDSYVKQEDGG